MSEKRSFRNIAFYAILAPFPYCKTSSVRYIYSARGSNLEATTAWVGSGILLGALLSLVLGDIVSSQTNPLA